MKLIENLMKTGLTQNEAKIYISLCTEGEMNGYEVAKSTGISRANAYQALASLVDKGGAHLIEGAVQHYLAVEVEDYCADYLRKTQEIAKQIKKECPLVKNKSEAYITIAGFDNIINKIKNIIRGATSRVYISLNAEDIELFKEDLIEASKKELKIVIITSKEINNLGIDASVYIIEKEPGQIRLISDSAEVITGEIENKENDQCLYSKNKQLIELAKEALRNEIILAELNEKNSRGKK